MFNRNIHIRLFLFFTSILKGLHAQNLEVENNLKEVQNNKITHWINHIVNDTSESKQARYLIYPTIGFSPETLWELGLSGICIFHFKNDTNIRLSEISAFSFYTQMKQVGLWIDHAVYGEDNRYLFLGKIRFQNYPLLYYGIGNTTLDEHLAVVLSNCYTLRERIVRRISGNFFAGLEIDYQQIANPNFIWSSTVPLSSQIHPTGSQGSKNLGLGIGVLLDSRKNILNVRDGYLFELAALYYPDIFSSSFKMQTLFIDGRRFYSTAKNQILALQCLAQFSSGNVPFNQLSLIGGDMMMRGYYLGKYRDKNYTAVQAEYRFLPFNFSKRLGGAVFLGTAAVSPTLQFNYLRWVAGGGLRYLLFPKKDIYTRLDIGIEPRGYGIYFFIGEAF